MAASVLFLAGPGGVFYNEQVLFPDGGESTLLFSSIFQASLGICLTWMRGAPLDMVEAIARCCFMFLDVDHQSTTTTQKRSERTTLRQSSKPQHGVNGQSLVQFRADVLQETLWCSQLPGPSEVCIKCRTGTRSHRKCKIAVTTNNDNG